MFTGVLNDRLPALMRASFDRMRQSRAIEPGAVDWLLMHFSSNWFRERLYDGFVEAGFPVPWERWFTNLATKGNTGAASIFILLEELYHSGALKCGEKLLCHVPESGRALNGFMLLEVV